MRRLVYGAKNHLFCKEKFMTQVRQCSGSAMAQGKGEASSCSEESDGERWPHARPTGELNERIADLPV